MVGSSCGWVGREEVKRDWSVFFFFFSALASAKKTKIGSVSFTSSVRERTDDMDPLSWHNRLLSCWQDQQIKNCSNPSLFRAICYAYGWPYVRLGLLKVLNDCIGLRDHWHGFSISCFGFFNKVLGIWMAMFLQCPWGWLKRIEKSRKPRLNFFSLFILYMHALSLTVLRSMQSP